jgi:hypothetical protein
LKYLRGNIALSAQQFKSPGLLTIKEGATADFGDIKAFIFKYDDEEKAKEQFDRAAQKLTIDKNKFSYEDDDAGYFVFHLGNSYITAIQTTAAHKSSERFKAIQNKVEAIR